MDSWGPVIQHLLNVFNIVTIAYFFLGNGVYTVLMLLSLGSTLIRNRHLPHHQLQNLRESGAAPPLTVIVPAYNEENSILETVRSVLQADYPDFHLVVVDDGSTDGTLARLIETFGLSRTDLITRSVIPAERIHGVYLSPGFPQLAVLAKAPGGKPDALNAGINYCRTPYFCTLDADCLIEPDALLRLMLPIVRSPVDTLVSGGIIRIRNGCRVANGRVQEARLPSSWLERLQVVEYLRGFLFGRTGWDLMGGTLIVSGAMAVFEKHSVLSAGGFSRETVSEDMELIVRLHRFARREKRRAKMTFAQDTVCWTECPSSLAMLARQRRRWQLGLCQTLWRNAEMLFNWKYGTVGMISFPFYLCVEALGAAVEFLGYLVVPVAFALHLALTAFYIPLVILSLVYASFLSVGAVLVEELTYRRYPARRDFYALLRWGLFENFGFRQMLLWFRFQGLVRFFAGFHRWEKIAHAADSSS